MKAQTMNTSNFFKADVYMIPCYGQSLSVNACAGPSTLSHVEKLSYDVNLNNTNIQDMCAGTAEGFRIMAEYHNIEIPENFKIIGCTGGAGGRSVLELSRGTSYYNNVINSVKTAKASCDAAGLSMIVPCFTWTQGEEDMRAGGNSDTYGFGNYNPHNYKERLKNLIEELNEDIKAITGQTEDVLCISYQLTSHPAYARYPRIAFQQLELNNEYDKMIIAKVIYDLEFVTEGEVQVHAFARSYRNMGNLYGIAAFNACVLKNHNNCCRPVDYKIDENKVQIKFDAPHKPIVFDTELINQLPDGNYGFNIYNVVEVGGSSGSSIKQAETKITDVELIGDDTVLLTLSRPPVVGETLTYGVNGDYWQNINGTRDILTGGEGEDRLAKCGWQHGSRGCLRDSQPYKNNFDGAVFKNLYNWCVLFEIPFTNENLGNNKNDSSDEKNNKTYNLTVTTNVDDAIVVINKKECASMDILEDTVATWEVFKSGYAPQGGSITMNEDKKLDVNLSELAKYEFTITPVPEDANVLIEDEVTSTYQVYHGHIASWVVSKDGYITKTGKTLINKEINLTVELEKL